MPTRRFALCGVGRDRPGIVAGVAAVLLRHGVNIEDSQATILGGHFALVLVVAAPDDVDVTALKADLGEAESELGLATLVLSPIEEARRRGRASHIVTVYGADHPGIVHAVASALAARGVGITDLQTRLGEDSPDERLYVLLMEVELPARAAADVEADLAAVAREQGVEVTFRPLDADPL